jgi:hypothetical protein
MHIVEFLQLADSQKYFYLRKDGIALAERFSGNSQFYLNALYSFYVEMIQERNENQQKFISINRIFDDTTYLDDYLQEMDISEINFFE